MSEYLCKTCGKYAGTHACNAKDVSNFSMQKLIKSQNDEIQQLRKEVDRLTTTAEKEGYKCMELEADAKRWNYFIETCSEEVAFYITGITGDVTNEQINDAIDSEMLRIGVE